jgi:dTDP-4-dehydrorhamnose 3,5-epimerase
MSNRILTTPLKIINSQEGSVLHFIKIDDNGFEKFGEVYFSTVNKNCLKAWKLHKKMTLNLVVPVGRVLFHFIDARPESKDFNNVQSFMLSQSPYFRLTVPPMFWFGFKGISDEVNLISNQSNIKHDPKEVERKPLNAFDVDWRIE